MSVLALYTLFATFNDMPKLTIVASIIAVLLVFGAISYSRPSSPLGHASVDSAPTTSHIDAYYCNTKYGYCFKGNQDEISGTPWEGLDLSESDNIDYIKEGDGSSLSIRVLDSSVLGVEGLEGNDLGSWQLMYAMSPLELAKAYRAAFADRSTNLEYAGDLSRLPEKPWISEISTTSLAGQLAYTVSMKGVLPDILGGYSLLSKAGMQIFTTELNGYTLIIKLVQGEASEALATLLLFKPRSEIFE